jgi:hypothetical protein
LFDERRTTTGERRTAKDDFWLVAGGLTLDERRTTKDKSLKHSHTV